MDHRAATAQDHAGREDWGRLIPLPAADGADDVYEDIAGDIIGDVDEVAVARERLQALARFASLLTDAIPSGFDVSCCCEWHTAAGARLRPDLLVHHDLDGFGRLPAAPILFVDLLPPTDPRVGLRSLARCGVDHYWQLDADRRLVETYVRIDADYRHAETLDAAASSWADFGIGLVHLDLFVLFSPDHPPPGTRSTTVASKAPDG